MNDQKQMVRAAEAATVHIGIEHEWLAAALSECVTNFQTTAIRTFCTNHSVEFRFSITTLRWNTRVLFPQTM